MIAHTEHPPRKAHPSQPHVQLSRQPSQIRPRPKIQTSSQSVSLNSFSRDLRVWQPRPLDFLRSLFSCAYKSIFPQFPSFHIYTKPWGFLPDDHALGRTSTSRRQPTSVFSAACRLLVSLCSLLSSSLVCFQSFAASSCKIGGWGTPQDQLVCLART